VVTGAVVALNPQGAITGHVTDGDGEPIDGAQVGVVMEQWARGRPIYMTHIESTNERGEYRVALSAGRYFIGAAPARSDEVPAVFSEGPGKPEMRVARVMYPNSPDIAGATAVEVRAGQQYGGIDLQLPTVAVFHVHGAVRPWGSWTGPRALSLTPRGGGPGYFDYQVSLDKDGGFDVAGVMPGSYWLEALDMSLGGTPVAVEVTDRDAEGVVFPAVPPAVLKGRVRFADDGPHDWSKMHVRVIRLDSSHPLGHEESEIRADGTFAFGRIAAEQTAFELTPPGDDYVQSAMLNQREVEGGVLDLTAGGPGELEIVLGTGTGTVSGTLEPQDGWRGEVVAVLAPAAGVTGNTGVRSAAIDQSGHFQFSFVPPGRYYVWAVANYDADHWQNMDFVSGMQARGVAVELEQKGSAQVEIPAVVE